MSQNPDMAEAVRMLAAEKGISVDMLLQALADALVSAYKRRPGAADEVEVQIEPETDPDGVVTENITFSSLNLDECRALRDYLDNVLEEADYDSESDFFSAAHPVEGFDEEEGEKGEEDVISCGSRMCERCTR